jgi:hypothetical protein
MPKAIAAHWCELPPIGTAFADGGTRVCECGRTYEATFTIHLKQWYWREV